MASMDRRLGLLVVYDAPRAVLPSLSSGPRCPSSWPAWTTGQLEPCRCSSWTRFSTCPLLCNVWCHGPDSQCWWFRSCRSSRSSALPVDTQRQIPMVLAAQMTISIPQLQLIDNVAVLVVHVVQVPQVQVVFLACFLISWCRSWRRQSRFFSCRGPQDKSLTCPLLSTTDARWFRQCRKLWRFMHSCSTSEGGRCPRCVGRAGSTVACGDSRDHTVAGRRELLTLWR